MPFFYLIVEVILLALLLFIYLKASHHFHWFDVPSEDRKIHHVSKPTSAGLIFILPVFCFPLFFTDTQDIYIIFLLLFVLLVVGGIDDFIDVSSKLRLHIQWAVSLLLVYLIFDFQLSSIAWILLYFLGVIWWLNLFNFMDGSDGMAVIQAILPLLFYYYFLQDSFVAPLIIILLVALLVFLPFNFPKSTMFMGDSGSLSVSFLLAFIALFGISQGFFDEITVVSLHLVFIVDATLTLIMRWFKGHQLTQAHNLHLFQSLIFHGKSHVFVALVYALVTLLLLLLTLYLHMLEYDWQIRSIILLFEIIVLSLIWYNFIDKNRFTRQK